MGLLVPVAYPSTAIWGLLLRAKHMPPQNVSLAPPRPACLQACNFPAIDSLVQPSSLLQMTIMQKSDINTAGLTRAHKQLRGPSPKRLYFVVPASLYDGYSVVKGAGLEVPQWVLRMDWV